MDIIAALSSEPSERRSSDDPAAGGRCHAAGHWQRIQRRQLAVPGQSQVHRHQLRQPGSGRPHETFGAGDALRQTGADVVTGAALPAMMVVSNDPDQPDYSSACKLHSRGSLGW